MKMKKMTYFARVLAFALAAVLSFSLLASCTPATQGDTGSTDSCVDGSCDIPDYDEDGNQVYSIVSPVGYCAIDPIEQAPRLDTLAGKKIALVGGSFMAAVTHAELKKCIQEEFPTAEIYMFEQVGSGGPYSVFGQSQQTKNFMAKLEQLGIDAVISGNCGCGLCTTKETGSSIAAEYMGIPSVTVGAPVFIKQIHSTGVNRGVPVLRTAEYPGPFSSHSTEELVKNAREVLWPQVKTGLTAEITQDEIDMWANSGKLPYDEIVYYGSYDDVQEYCRINEWTDGLPVVPATDERVREYLEYTPYEAEDVLGTYALAYRECLVYTVAVNAVMAGVPKEYMPICIAFTKCLQDGEWRRPLASTHGWSPFAWLNGPLARQLGIDNSQGMISEENNKALGRFIDLVMLNIGGYYVKENRMGTFGYLTPWTFSENEEACLSIGWDPYHVTKGYELNSNTLTAGSALAWGNNVTPATDDAEKIMQLMAWDITEKQQNGLGNTNPQVYRTIFITADVAKDLASKYRSKYDLEDALILTARRPLYMRVYANYWANTGSQQYIKYSFEEYYDMLLNDPDELAEMTDTPEWLKGIIADEQIMTIATMRKGQTPLLVTGDSDRNKFQVMPGGGYVTFEIELPDNWNELVLELGYEPIENFYLDPDDFDVDVNVKPEENESKEMTVPSVLKDGTYRMVPSLEQLTAAGRVFFDTTNALTYWNEGAASSASVTLSTSTDKNFIKLLNALSYNCSFTVSGGKVTEIIVRPSTVTRKPVTDISILTPEDLKDIKLTVAANPKQSVTAGGVSPAGTTIVVSGSVTSFEIDLGGTIVADKNNPAKFVKISGNKVTIDSSVATDTTAKFGVKLSDGSYRTFTFTKRSSGSVGISYNPEDTIKS